MSWAIIVWAIIKNKGKQMKHLKYGGSTMARTLACPAWVSAAAEFPKQQSSSAADEGSLLHNCMEAYCTTRTEPKIGQTFGTATLTHDMIVNKYRPALIGLHNLTFDYDIKDDIFYEPFVELIPDLSGGSIDVLAFSQDGKTAMIMDYKFGHVTVHAEDNKQMLFYALCAAVDPQFSDAFESVENLVLIINQPNDDGDTIDLWETPIETLDTFELAVYEAIDKAEKGTGEHKSGAHCNYCPAAATCPIKTGAVRRSQQLSPEKAEQISEALKLIPDINSWIKAVEKAAYEALDAGTPVEGFKLVQKRAVRKWSDPAAVRDILRKKRKILLEEVVDTKLKSVAQLEKVFKSKSLDLGKIGDYIISVSSGTTVAPASDKRPDAAPVAAFEALAAELQK